MADYSLQYPGATIDQLLGKVTNADSAPTANSENLVKSGGVKTYVDGKTGDLSQLQTTAKNNLVAAINEAAQSGGVGSDPEAVKYTPQSLTDAQKAQARQNIGVDSSPVNPVVGFSTPATPDGTIIAEKANGDTEIIDLNHNHPQYYSKVVETSIPSGGLLPDVVYNLGTLTGSVAFSLAAAVTGNVNHYFWMFETGSTAPTVTWPSSNFAWADGTGPTVAASKHYEISVLNGIATFLEV